MKIVENAILVSALKWSELREGMELISPSGFPWRIIRKGKDWTGEVSMDLQNREGAKLLKVSPEDLGRYAVKGV